MFPKYITQEDFISYILSFSSDSFIDIEKDYCNFEDKTFAEMIKFSSELPSKDELNEQMYADAIKSEYNEIIDGKQLISLVETGNPIFELLKLRALYGDNVEFVGFPTNSGNGIAMTPFIRVAMSSSSPLKDSVQIFFDYLLSESFQAEMSKLSYMPVINDYLDEYISGIVAGYREKPLKLAISDMMILECPPIDDNTVNKVWDLIHRIDCINEYDPDIYQIVLEESQTFFAGHKDISDVIHIIQSRASIYVHEKQ